MGARYMSSCRSIKTLQTLRQLSADQADAQVGDLIIPLRGKVRNTPDAWDDIPISNVRKFYETVAHWAPFHKFDSSNKIRRLEQRRQARKAVEIIQYAS